MSQSFLRGALRIALSALVVLPGLGCAGSAGRSEAQTVPERTGSPTSRTADEPRDPGARAMADAGGAAYHVVEPGETLSSISRTYGVSVGTLAQANDLADPDRIAVGQRLVIPGAAPASGAADPADAWVWPVPEGRVLSSFGAARRTHRHQGIDIAGRAGQEVLATYAGRVVYSGAGMRGYGKTIMIDHGDGLLSLYAHNSTLLAKKGQFVHRGQPIARVGQSGNATTEHCHFEVRRHDVALDPLGFLAASAAHGQAAP